MVIKLQDMANPIFISAQRSHVFVVSYDIQGKNEGQAFPIEYKL